MCQSDIVLLEPLAKANGHQTWFLVRLANALTAVGKTPAVITFDGMNEAGLGVPLAAEVSHESYVTASRGRALSMLIRRMSRHRKLKAVGDVLRIFAVLLYARRRHRRTGSRAVHLLSPPSRSTLALVGLLWPKRTKIFISAYRAPWYGDTCPRFLRLWLDKDIHIVTQVPSLKRAWERAFPPEDVHLIPLGYSEDAEPALDESVVRNMFEVPEGMPIVSIVGHIRREKGYVELLNAVKRLAPNFFIIIAGYIDQDVEAHVRHAVRLAGWESNTRIHGAYIDELTFNGIIKASNVVSLLYSTPDASSGILALCRQFRRAVVATKFGELGASVRATNLGICVDPNDDAEVALALNKLLDCRFVPNGVSSEDYLCTWIESAGRHAALYKNTNRLLSTPECHTAPR